jgi:hypothetical protein
VKFDIGGLYRNLVKTVHIWLKFDKKYWTLYVKTEIRFIFTGEVKCPYKLSLRVKWYRAA